MGAIDIARTLAGGQNSPLWRNAKRIVRSAFPEDFETFARRRRSYQDAPYSDFSETEQSIYRAAFGTVEGSAEAIVSLMRAVEHVVRNAVAGALVECGVYKGGNVGVMIRRLQELRQTDRDIYLYDTFAGMPRPLAWDDEKVVGADWRRHHFDPTIGDAGSRWLNISVDQVRGLLHPLGYPPERLHFVKGLVEETIPKVAPDKIAILRLDTDFYTSTKHELEHLYPRLVSGGILIIDDYGAFPGCKRAVDEYQAENGSQLFLNRVDRHVRLAVKP
jgi:O-methyltransferase